MFSRKRRGEESEKADTALAEACAQLDLFSGRLDTLKRTFNETAKELGSFPPPKFAANGAGLGPQPQPRPAPSPTGRYSVNDPTAPEVVDLEHHLRPLPRLAAAPAALEVGPPRTRSGRFYLQLANANSADELRKVRDTVSKVGRIVDSGQGTASDPEAGWMEVAVRADDTGSFVVKLEELEVKSRVEKLIEVSPGEGRLQARQLDLFRKKQDSSSEL
jgi:hypothetical protein